MKTIVVATDLTARSDRALARGLALGAEMAAEVHVVHVVDRSLPTALRAHTLDWARESLLRDLGEQTGTPTRIHVRAGRPREDVVAEAHRLGAELIVLGLPDKDSQFRSVFADSTAGQIMKRSHLPVLLAGGPAGAPYARAVIGVDFSPYGRAALRLTHAVAPAAAFRLVHAYQLPPRTHLASAEYRAGLEADEAEALRAFLADEMALLEEHARTCGIPPEAITRLVREGPPFQVLRDACAEANADLLAIGTHGRTGIARALFGSVAAALLDDPPCDVLVARLG
jgi:nucleotide-binding universal stress UspA family protein